MKTEVCLMCVVCFVLGWFVHNIVGKCGREHLATQQNAIDNKQKRLGRTKGTAEEHDDAWHERDREYVKCAYSACQGNISPALKVQCIKENCTHP